MTCRFEEKRLNLSVFMRVNEHSFVQFFFKMVSLSSLDKYNDIDRFDFQFRNRIIFWLLDFDDDVRVHYRNRRHLQRINFNLTTSSFRETFRVDQLVFDKIERSIGIELQRRTFRSYALSAREQILITLHFLGNGAQYHVNGYLHGIDKGTVCRCVHEVCRLVTVHLMPLFIKWPSNSANILRQFERKAGFPNVIGIIDGTLIHMDAPTDDEPIFVSRDNRHSINTLVVSGPNNEFFYVSAKAPGSFHDSRCLQISSLWNAWEHHQWRPRNANQSIILGDSAYPLKSWLMTPTVRNINMVPEFENAINLYQRKHRTTRFIVECTIGIWKEEYPVLNGFRFRSPVRISNAIYATATLHNMQNFHRNGSYNFDRNLNAIANREHNEIEIIPNIDEHNAEIILNDDVAAVNRQREFIEYFM